jgi:hypothetical protein
MELPPGPKKAGHPFLVDRTKGLIDFSIVQLVSRGLPTFIEDNAAIPIKVGGGTAADHCELQAA